MKQFTKSILFAFIVGLIMSCSSSDSNSNPVTHYKVQISGTLKTTTCDVTTNSYDIKLEYLSDGNVVDTQQWNGNTEQSVTDFTTTLGNVIGARVKLMNFNSTDQSIGRGTGFNNIHIKIINADTNQVLIDQDSSIHLFICTDCVYQADYLYNTANGTLSSNSLTFGF